MSEEKLLSVVVPVYNAKRYLKECVFSILGQEYRNLEIILVDDGSTDGSFDVCNRFLFDKRVTVLHKSNEGPMRARMMGVEYSKGDFITFVDSDDWIDSQMYSKLMIPINQMDVDLSLCGIVRAYDKTMIDEPPLLRCGLYDKDQLDSIRTSMIWSEKYECNLLDQSLCTKVIKKKYLYEFMKKAEKINIHYNEDTAVVFPMIDKIETMSVIEDCLYFHRQRIDALPEYLLDSNFFHKMFSFYKLLVDTMDGRYSPAIEQYFLYTLNQRKRIYSSLKKRNTCYYPIDRFEKNTKFVLCGAGRMGQELYDVYQKIQFGKMIAWVDGNKFGQKIKGELLLRLEDVMEEDVDYYVVAVYSEIDADEIIRAMVDRGIDKKKILWKKIHIYE